MPWMIWHDIQRAIHYDDDYDDDNDDDNDDD